jgi:hypothetical protein
MHAAAFAVEAVGVGESIASWRRPVAVEPERI